MLATRLCPQEDRHFRHECVRGRAKRLVWAAFSSLLLPCLLSADTLAEKIDAALQKTEASKQAFWGIRVIDLANGSEIYARNEDRFFVPASNTKLFSTSLALMRLGPEHRFTTSISANARPDSKGHVATLRLVGGGDPNLSARTLPYQHNSFGPNALAVIEWFADTLVAAGVTTVDGDIIGDDTAYGWEPFPDGWSVDDPIWEYGAPVSALTLNDNAFALGVTPGLSVGEPGTLTLLPPLEYLTIHNRTRTVKEGQTKLTYDRLPGSSELVVSGIIRINSPTVKALLGVDDPALFAAHALRDALLRRGVQVQGNAVALHRSPGEDIPSVPSVELARHVSLPLIDAIRVVNKVSQNLHAEILLREVARVHDGIGTRQGGLNELKAFLSEIGIADKQYNFVDGSGLSRLTLLTPRTVSILMTYMYNTPHRDAWISTLPIGGQDGTLSLRFARSPEGEHIRAKTGALSHVSALAGYALRPDGGSYAFSILVNNYGSEAAAIRKTIDEIALMLLRD